MPGLPEGVSLRRNRTPGAGPVGEPEVEVAIPIPIAEGEAASVVVEIEPGGGGDVGEASALGPRLRKQHLRSWPLNPRPSRIMRLSAAQALSYSRTCGGVEADVEGDCDTTCRQKKLHKSPVSGALMKPLVT